MDNSIHNPFFRTGNWLFSHAYSMYRPLYKLYKTWGDRYELRLIREFVTHGMTVVDIGANIGIYTDIFSHRVGERGKVIAFEPSPVNYGHLAGYGFGYDNVELVNAAVGDTTGEVFLRISQDLNVDHRTYDTGEKRDTISVKCYRLDDFLENGKVDFIKIDIQGYEYRALSGMKKTLETNRDIKLLLEFWPYGLKAAGDSPESFLRLLRISGFTIKIRENNRWIECSSPPDNDSFDYYRTVFAAR